jgi:hypothetical protein
MPTNPLIDREWDLTSEPQETNAFLQWKNTDACFDFRCECGAKGHFWEMPAMLFPRKSKRDPARGGIVELQVDDDD